MVNTLSSRNWTHCSSVWMRSNGILIGERWKGVENYTQHSSAPSHSSAVESCNDTGSIHCALFIYIYISLSHTYTPLPPPAHIHTERVKREQTLLMRLMNRGRHSPAKHTVNREAHRVLTIVSWACLAQGVRLPTTQAGYSPWQPTIASIWLDQHTVQTSTNNGRLDWVTNNEYWVCALWFLIPSSRKQQAEHTTGSAKIIKYKIWFLCVCVCVCVCVCMCWYGTLQTDRQPDRQFTNSWSKMSNDASSYRKGHL